METSDYAKSHYVCKKICLDGARKPVFRLDYIVIPLNIAQLVIPLMCRTNDIFGNIASVSKMIEQVQKATNTTLSDQKLIAYSILN